MKNNTPKNNAPMAAVEDAACLVASGPLLAGCVPTPVLAGCLNTPASMLADCVMLAEKSPLLAGCVRDGIGTRALKSK